MPNLNKIFLSGHLTRDPETKHTQGGTTVCVVGIAVNHKYQTTTGWKEEVCFVDVVGFGKLAEFLSECRKGQAVMVAGRLDYQMWQTESGQKRGKHQLRAEMIMPAAERKEDYQEETDIPF